MKKNVTLSEYLRKIAKCPNCKKQLEVKGTSSKDSIFKVVVVCFNCDTEWEFSFVIAEL